MSGIINKICMIFASCAMLLSLCRASAGFRLCEKDGFVAVWDCTAAKWLLITDTPAASLPAADREALRQGIGAASQEELSSLLEDYCS